MRETRLYRQILSTPSFVVEGTGIQREIAAMPGNYHWSVDRLPSPDG